MNQVRFIRAMSALSSQVKTTSRGLLRLFDVEVSRYSRSLRAKRARVLDEAEISLVLDVGANAGQYAQEIRASGYGGRILSFEPLPDAFAQLSRNLASDPLWEGRRLAAGETDGIATMNVAGNSWSSSLLPMLGQHREAAPQAGYVGTCSVPLSGSTQPSLPPPSMRSEPI